MPPSIKNKYQNLKNPSASQEVPVIKNSIHGKYGNQWGEWKKQNRQSRFFGRFSLILEMPLCAGSFPGQTDELIE